MAMVVLCDVKGNDNDNGGGVGGGDVGDGLGVLTTVILNFGCLAPFESNPPTSWVGAFHNEDRILAIFICT